MTGPTPAQPARSGPSPATPTRAAPRRAGIRRLVWLLPGVAIVAGGALLMTHDSTWSTVIGFGLGLIGVVAVALPVTYGRGRGIVVLIAGSHTLRAAVLAALLVLAFLAWTSVPEPPEPPDPLTDP